MTPSFNNGIFLRETQVNLNQGANLDYYHLSNMGVLQDPGKNNLGLIDIWAMKQKAEMPLYTMSSFGGKNVIPVDGHFFEWGIPISNDLPIIKEFKTTRSDGRIGIDGQPFQIVLSRRAYGHGAILTYDKYNGKEFFVTDAPIRSVGDGFEYTVELVRSGKSDEYIDSKYLAPGTKIFRTGSAKGDYAQRLDDGLDFRAGMRKFYNFVGLAEAHAEGSISKWAAMASVKEDIVELVQVAGADPSVRNIDDLRKRFSNVEDFKNYMTTSTTGYGWMRKIEAQLVTKVAKDIENYLMWGKGGRITGQGADDVRLSVGLWKQLDNGNKVVYTKPAFSLKLFKTAIYNYFNGKVDFDKSDAVDRTLVVQTGLAGMQMISEAIAREVGGTGYILNATDLGAVSGDPMNLMYGVNWTAFKIPFLANLKFVVNPAFDNKEINAIENPIVEGFPLSSYSFIIYDFNYEQGNDNIVLLKYAPGKNLAASDLMWNYQPGTMPYGGLGQTKGFMSVGNHSGFKVNVTQLMPAIFVKDPTRVLKITMKNPITGGSF